MSIQSNGTYIPTMDEFLSHWELCNTSLGAKPLKIAIPKGPLTTRAQFEAVRTTLILNQNAVQAKLNIQQIARGAINLSKEALLKTLNLFVAKMDAYYQGTAFYNAKPLVPGVGEGQENFTRPMVDAMTLWELMNAGPAPEGVTLPLVLSNLVDQGTFASSISMLQFHYQAEQSASKKAEVAREDRNLTQVNAYELMKAYRLAVPSECSQFPNLLATLPKLTPEPGHTPDAVNASATYVAPSTSHVVHSASTDADVDYYDLEGTNGDEWNADDAVHLGRHLPSAANEFTVDFGLTQPGTAVALKVYVVLKTGNRAGSATMIVQRPL